MLIIGGTSLAVYPAAGLIRYYRGNKLTLINKSPTPYDREADLVIQRPPLARCWGPFGYNRRASLGRPSLFY